MAANTDQDEDNPFKLLMDPLPADPCPLLRKECEKRLKEKGERYTVKSDTISSTSTQLTAYDKSGYPIIIPLKTLDSLLRWESGRDDLSVASIPLISRESDPFLSPNVLVCHDMMGGYTNDRFIQGCQAEDDYYFYHWANVSTFVYFSHNFVTIPPPSWTNAAHRNGVLCLGTVITEWKDGAILCSNLFSNEITIDQAVDKLIEIAVYYKFDGWLINIENPIQFYQLDSLVVFLTLLTTGLHTAIPGSKVIWYDSVISTTGGLIWQNMLNDKNQQYFDICDGIFLNYHWTRQSLVNSVSSARGRSQDVYVGVDVFGRGCFGGGGYDTNIALELISKHGLSAAIFAPGWVYENNSKSNFFANNDKFWSLLSPYCPVYAHSSLPLISSFSRGRGCGLYINGKVEYQRVWSNYSAQSVQLSFSDKLFQKENKCSVDINNVLIKETGSAYNNGSCLSIHGVCGQGDHTPAIVRLFKTSITCIDGPFLISYSFHSSLSQLSHMLRLRTDGLCKFILLDPSPSTEIITITSKGIPLSSIKTTTTTDDQYKRIMALSNEYEILMHALMTGTYASTNSKDDMWTTRYFILNEDCIGGTIKGVSLSLDGQVNSQFNLLIGEIKITSASILYDTSFPTVTRLNIDCITCKDPLHCTLVWDHTCSPLDSIDHYNIYWSYDNGETTQLLGRAYVDRFSVVNLKIREERKGEERRVRDEVMFLVQCVSVNGRCLSLANSTSLTLHL